MTDIRVLISGFAALVIMPNLVHAQTPVNLHRMTWLVHIDLIDETAGRDLDFYRALLEGSMAEASTLLQGDQGPFDTACCIELDPISIDSFGAPGDGLDILDSAADLDVIAATGLPGSRGFLVQSIDYCGGPTSAIGCAHTPTCDGNPDDDPNLWLTIAFDFFEFDPANYGGLIAHERGHNACLPHPPGGGSGPGENVCQVMFGRLMGCLTDFECTNYVAARNATGGECACHSSSTEVLADGSICSTGSSTGLCSGGLCGDFASDASVRMIGAGGTESLATADTKDAILMSGLTSGWSQLGPFGGNLQVEGLAFSPRRNVLYGVVNPPTGPELVTVDPNTGQFNSSLGSLQLRWAGGTFTALAFDPGETPGPADDRLLGIETEAECSLAADCASFLIEVDPDTGATTFLGDVNALPGGWQGLAYDSANQALYGSAFRPGTQTPSALFEIDASCPGSTCFASFTPRSDDDPFALTNRERVVSSLAYSQITGRLYAVSTSDFGDLEIVYFDSIDTATLESDTTIVMDGFTVGGLAALPEPDPTLQFLSAIAVLILLGWIRRRQS